MTTTAKNVATSNKNVAKDIKSLKNVSVLPIVSSKTKEVFLKVITKKSDEATQIISQSIADKTFIGMSNDLRAFVKNRPDTKVWHSKAANVRKTHLEKSQNTQVEFWQRSGFTVANLEEMVAAMKAAPKSSVRKRISSKTPSVKKHVVITVEPQTNGASA